ncbi:TetR/AcrR family transcriptional regulator [Paenibacillus paridis]|uniref:TetR/AcrR family transcriptional regulator n=1 Tax=Paenibacillus paridis TaxID=2583376 RepID=UPI001120CB36|nr:TetR/AcrR family transcriptional regulator [Paenibacillus paridis]
MIKKHSQRAPGRPKHAKDDPSIREMIIKTASKRFMEYGYESVSLLQIAEECQVSKPAIYYHFTSKPELFKVAVTTVLNQVHRHISRILQEAEHLEDGLVTVAEARLTNPHAEIETMLREAEPFLNEEQLMEIRQSEHSIYQLLAEHFQTAMDNHVLRVNDPMLLAQTFSAMMLLGNQKDTLLKYESNRALAKEVVGIFLRGTSNTGNKN